MKKIYLFLSFFLLISCSGPKNDDPSGSAGVPNLYLGGIMYNEKDPTATINNTLVKIGDEIEGLKIVDITRDKVFFSNDFSLEVGQATTNAVRQKISRAVESDKKDRVKRIQKKQAARTEEVETNSREERQSGMSDVFPKKSIHSLEGMFEAYKNAQDLADQANQKARETRRMTEEMEGGY